MKGFTYRISSVRRRDGRRRTPAAFIIALALLCGSQASAFADEFSQVTHHSMELMRGTVEIDTRVGDIFIEGWDKARVEVQAEKVVRAGSEKKAQPMFDRIRVDLSTDDEQGSFI